MVKGTFVVAVAFLLLGLGLVHAEDGKHDSHASHDHGVGHGHSHGHTSSHGHGHGDNESWKKPIYLDELLVLVSVILFLGLSYEHLEHTVMHSVPSAFKVVIHSMLNELAALGFVSTVTFVITHPGSSKAGTIVQQLLDNAGESLGTTFEHMLHHFELLHFGLFFVVNFYCLQIMFLVWKMTSKLNRVGAAQMLFSQVIKDTSQNIQKENLESVSNNWEDATTRMAILDCMSYRSLHAGGVLAKALFGNTDPDPSSFGLLGYAWLFLSEFLEGVKSELSELFLFRESMRLLLAPRAHRSEALTQDGHTSNMNHAHTSDEKQALAKDKQPDTLHHLHVPFFLYMEQSIADVLGRLVTFSWREWCGVWLAMTLFTCATRFLRSIGYSASEATACAYLCSQAGLLLATFSVLVFLARTKSMLRPRASSTAQRFTDEHRRKGKLPASSLTTSSLWSSATLLDPPPYLKLPAREAHLGVWPVVRDLTRGVCGWRQPSMSADVEVGKHQQLFGVMGASGPECLYVAVKLIFLGSTILAAANFSALDARLMTAYFEEHPQALAFYAHLPDIFQSVHFKGCVVRLISLIPDLLVFSMMPGLVFNLTVCTQTQALADKNRIKACLATRERQHLAAALKGLLSIAVLYRDANNNLEVTLAFLRKQPFRAPHTLKQQHRSVDEEGQLKLLVQAHAHEELALLESFFFRGKRGVKHQDTRLSKDELAEVFKSMLLDLSEEDVGRLFGYMDVESRKCVSFSQFACGILLPVAQEKETEKKNASVRANSEKKANEKKEAAEREVLHTSDQCQPHHASSHEEASVLNHHDLADRTCERLFNLLDINADGSVDLSEFQSVMKSMLPSLTPSASLIQIFSQIDSERKGFVTKEALRQWMRKAFASTPLDDEADKGHHPH